MKVRPKSASRGEPGCELRDYRPTVADLAWLFGVSGRWIGKLRSDGVLPVDAALPDLVKRMVAYQAKAKEARRGGYRARRSNG